MTCYHLKTFGLSTPYCCHLDCKASSPRKRHISSLRLGGVRTREAAWEVLPTSNILAESRICVSIFQLLSTETEGQGGSVSNRARQLSGIGNSATFTGCARTEPLNVPSFTGLARSHYELTLFQFIESLNPTFLMRILTPMKGLSNLREMLSRSITPSC